MDMRGKFTTDELLISRVGELDNNNTLNGNGIEINPQTHILFGYFHRSSLKPGNYICVYNNGDFDVGEAYFRLE